PRVFPEGRGRLPNQRGLDFYSRLVDGMLERNLEPWCTLYHWDLPQSLQDQGGWVNRSTIDAFEAYADVVSRHLGDRIKQWITHNEPWCTAFHGNFDGVHAPGLKSFKTALQVCHNVLVSHGTAIPIIRANSHGARVGIALSLHPLRAASNRVEDEAAKVRHDGLRNRWFLDPLHGRGYPQDIVELLGANAPHMEADDLAIMADSNPLFVDGRIRNDRAGTCSDNHGGAGQNVLYATGEVRWSTTSAAGVGGSVGWANTCVKVLV
ncbi:MAG: family 1 glycosylhydrolase, partial [Verrucomicrobiota bacterium]